MTTRKPRGPANEPRAPKADRLFQEDLLQPRERFWMVVACQLVNLTTWTKAQHAFEWLRAQYVSPRVLAVAEPEDLHETLQPLGLWRKRSSTLIALANAWVRSPPSTAQDVLRLPGCGKYAADSWAIFVEGRSDVQATDGKLLWHLERLKESQLDPAPPRRRPARPRRTAG